jgi:hypothetical protein
VRRIALVVVASLALGVLGASAAGWYRTHDFYAIYSGPRMVVRGMDPYDEHQWCAFTENTTPEAFDRSRDIAVCFVRYAYPMWTAVLLVPLGILPLPVAASLWLALSLALFVAALRWAWLAVGGLASWMMIYATIVVFSQPFALLLALGQMGAVLFAISAFTTYALSRRSDRAAGATLALTALKPNVLFVFAVALLTWAAAARRRVFVAAALLAGAALVALSLIPDPLWPRKWLNEIFGRQIGHSIEYATAWGLAAVDLDQPALAPVLIFALVATVLWLARGRLRDPVALSAVAVPISTFATPYAWSYDDLVLALPWALVLAIAARSRPVMRLTLLVALLLVAIVAPWFFWSIAAPRHTESLTSLVPAATALLAAAALRFEPRSA